MAESDAATPAVRGRYLAIDERGRGLRITWRPAHGFFNVSLWHEDRCVETFHLAPHDAGDVVAFLGRSLGDAAPVAPRRHLAVVGSDADPPRAAGTGPTAPPAAGPRSPRRAEDVVRSTAQRAAAVADDAIRRTQRTTRELVGRLRRRR